jgi:MFS family permease
MDKNSYKEALYTLLSHEDDARICKNIPEKACREVPRNFLLTLFSYFCNKLADSLANPKIILPWIMQSIGAPLFLISLLVPIRESGALLPQLFLAGIIRKIPIRKWVWVAGVILQAICILLMALTAQYFSGFAGGILIISLLIVFSCARGLSSIASKDVMGKTIPKKRRGILNGWSASMAGFITLGFGAYIYFAESSLFSRENTYVLLLLSASLWLIAAIFYGRIAEFEGETEGGQNALEYALSRLKLIKEDKTLLRFIVARAFFLCSTLSAPFYVLLAYQYIGDSTMVLSMFIISSGLAALGLITLLGIFFRCL